MNKIVLKKSRKIYYVYKIYKSVSLSSSFFLSLHHFFIRTVFYCPELREYVKANTLKYNVQILIKIFLSIERNYIYNHFFLFFKRDTNYILYY